MARQRSIPPTMTPLVPIAMFGIIPLALKLFDKYPARIAAAAVFVMGWLFLPQAKYDIPILPDYAKTNALGLAVLSGILFKDRQILKSFRFRWMDIPMACWCMAPFFSSVSNDLGAWDGGSSALATTVSWGLPYLIGRLYFGSPEALRELAIGMLIGGVVVAPLAIIEMIISPQLHIFFYGWYPHDFSQSKRGGGYRPSVFMAHGLELAMWNAAAAFMGWQLFLRKSLEKKLPFFQFPLLPSVIGVTLVLVLSRSAGALMLFLVAMGVFEVCVRMKTKIPLLFFLLLPVFYMNLRAVGAWDGQSLVEAAGKLSGSVERTGSLAYRLYNENLLVEKALLRPVFGWGGFNRSFVTNENGIYISVPDGMWILTLGKNGLFGLTVLSLSILLAPIMFFIFASKRRFAEPLTAPSAAFAMFLGVFMADNLFNAMYNPILMLAAGGLTSLVLSGKTEPSLHRLSHAIPLAKVHPVPVTRVI